MEDIPPLRFLFLQLTALALYILCYLVWESVWVFFRLSMINCITAEQIRLNFFCLTSKSHCPRERFMVHQNWRKHSGIFVVENVPIRKEKSAKILNDLK